MARHFVPLDVKTSKKLTAKIYMFDFFFLIGFASFAFMTQQMIIPIFRVIYIMFNLAVGLYLSRKSLLNPGKRVFESLWLYIRRPRTAYIPIELPKERIRGEREKQDAIKQ